MPTNQNYQDDFEDSGNAKFQDKKSIEFPKINNKNLSKSNSKNKLQNNSRISNENYDQEFQPDSAKSNKKKLNLNSNQQNINKIKKSTSTLNAKNSLKKRQNSNKKLSLGDLKNSNVQSEPKYISYLNNEFSHTREQIMQLQPQKINRLNEKLKSYIKKVNDDLTDLISQNMRKLQANTTKTANENKTVEDQIRILTEQKKSGEVFLENVQRQCQSLKEKWQKIKDQKLNQNIDQEISQTNLKIKETLKQINHLKHNVNQQGNKLTEDQNYVERINDLKIKISNLTKDEERNTERIYRNQAQFEQLNEKNPHIELLLEEMIQKAKNQSIHINSTSQDKKLKQKFDELKKKLQTQKAHIDKTQSLNQTKANILKRDNELIKNQATQIEKKSTQVDSQMASSKQATLALIEQAKQQDLQPYIQTHLDFISKNILQGNAYTLGIAKIQKKNSSKNLSQEGQKNTLKKYGSVANVRKYERASSDAELKPNFQIPKKSTFDEKKDKKNLKLKNQNHSSERVWKEDHNVQKAKHTSQSNNSSKPFIIRKAKNVPSLNDGTPKELKLDRSVEKNDEKQNQKSALLGPKMKFKKAQHHEPEIQNQRKNHIINQQNPNELQVPNKDQERPRSRSPFRIKKTVKQIVQIPDEELYVLGQVPKKDSQENLPSDSLQSKKEANLKFFRKPQNVSKTSPRQQSSIQEQIPANKEGPIDEDLEINVGRRQGGRKIQRKEESSYGN